jgi:hypothetical protein
MMTHDDDKPAGGAGIAHGLAAARDCAGLDARSISGLEGQKIKTTTTGESMNGLHSVPAPERNRVACGVSMPSVSPLSNTSDGALLAALREGHREFLRFAIRYTRNIRDGEALVGEFYREALGTAAMKTVGH